MPGAVESSGVVISDQDAPGVVGIIIGEETRELPDPEAVACKYEESDNRRCFMAADAISTCALYS